jgi:hypothetical protein
MRHGIAAALLLFPTAVMAGTFVYTPVHVAPIVHVAPMVHVAPAPGVHVNPGIHVHPAAKPTSATERTVWHRRLLPVVVDATPQNQKKCVKSDSKECGKTIAQPAGVSSTKP